MTLANCVLVFLWVGLTAYALLGGADFGAGFWDLVAGGTKKGARQRARIEESIGPVWEANHVWLIFALVVVWTGFPTVFAAVFSTLYIPLTAAAFGIILRGSAFAFRKAVVELPLQRAFGATFALSSLITPYFLGAAAGGIASGRVPLGAGQGDVLRSWLNPTSTLGGVLAIAICAYLAAIYLTADARRRGQIDLAEAFRRRGLAAALVGGATALAGIAVLRSDAPILLQGLLHRGWPLIVGSAVCGMASLLLLVARRYAAVRITAALAVVAVLWGWGVGQYPDLLVRTATVGDAAAPQATLTALLLSLSLGTLMLVPALVLLFLIFQREPPSRGHDLDQR